MVTFNSLATTVYNGDLDDIKYHLLLASWGLLFTISTIKCFHLLC